MSADLAPYGIDEEKFSEISRFPSIRRDIAIVVDEEVLAPMERVGQLDDLARTARAVEARGGSLPMLTLWIDAQNRWVALKDDRGASMVEYALLVVLIAIVAFVAVRFAGKQVSSVFDTIGKSLANS